MRVANHEWYFTPRASNIYIYIYKPLFLLLGETIVNGAHTKARIALRAGCPLAYTVSLRLQSFAY